MTTPEYWIATADGRKAHLFACRLVAGGRWHCDPRGSIESKWEGYHEHHRPSLLGRGPSPSAAQHFAGTGHELEEEERRFAHDIREWLGREARVHVTLFAPPRILGMLRRDLGDLEARVDLHEGELTRLRPNELAEHATVVSVLEQARKQARGAPT
jgi:protein required for attachment to host cells